MGNWFVKLFSFHTEKRIVMVGLDSAGKTTILYKMKLGELVQTLPTIGFNIESVEYKNIRFTVWDIGGQDRIRGLWRYRTSHAAPTSCPASLHHDEGADWRAGVETLLHRRRGCHFRGGLFRQGPH